MHLSTLGAKVAMFGDKEKAELASQLMKGHKPINAYTNGVCFDTVAFIRYLLNARISPNELVRLSGQSWKPKFDFLNGIKWNGFNQIPAGKAIGFYRPVDNSIFHAAISTGGTGIRAVNGHRLGSGWIEINLLNVLTVRNKDNSFEYDGTKIFVYLSKL